MIKRIAVTNSTITSTVIKSRLLAHAEIGRRTIQRRLQIDCGLMAYRPAKKLKLSPKNIRDRLTFARRYSNWPTEDWKKVTFSDESMFRQFSNFSTCVRRLTGERHNIRYTVPSVKQCCSVMVWGCITAQGRGALHIVPQKTTEHGTAVVLGTNLCATAVAFNMIVPHRTELP